MNRFFVHRLSYLLAAALVCSMAAVGCASSSDLEEADEEEQASSSSNDYDSAGDQPTESSDSPDNEGESGTPSESEPEPSPMPAGEESSSSGDQAKISDAQLREFAAISQEMQKIQVETKRKIKSAESRQEAKTIQKKAQQRVQQVFEGKEMTRQEYESIAQRLRSDKELQQRYRQQMQSP